MAREEKSLEENLPQIFAGFNKVLEENGVRSKMLRFMVGDPTDPEQITAQEEFEKMLEQLDTKNAASPRAFWCCRPAGCRICEIA